MIKRIINIALLISLFFAAPLIGEQVEELYWVGYASRKVEPAMVGDKRVATTFQISYEGMQYTLTNLHVCRIPNILEERRRRTESEDAQVNNKPIKQYPPLTDEDLVDKTISISGYDRKIIAVDYYHDLCLLEGNINLPSFSLAMDYQKGELVRIIGFPRGLDKTLRKGRIFGEERGWMPWIPRGIVNYKWISTLAYGGNSGSPVVNKYGNVVGVLFAGRRDIHTEALIVPLEDVRNFLHRVLD